MSASLSSISIFLGTLNSLERPEGNSTAQSTPKFLPYNYDPTEWVCITFLAVFGLSTGRAPPTSSTSFESLTMTVFRISPPYCTSNPFASLVAIPQRNFLWHSRGRRLECSTLVESEPFH